jgi:hypothetical protein
VQTSGEISAFLIGIGVNISSDFSRKPRKLIELLRYKATELRLDLLYICNAIIAPCGNQKFG